ncbi:UNVERIFIED_ORG: putative flippase GtrA [Paraburkholderia sediminicola]|nr:putative flippase GtrA [Paraburkholderia sediminicola]
MSIHPQRNSPRQGSAPRLAIIYAVLAAIATVGNIVSQDISLRLYTGARAIFVSVLVGTIVGLIIKYALDKKYIFLFKPKNAAHDVWTFVMYAAMGVVTTAIFWSFEFAFNHAFHTKEARFLGGVIGLAIGYVSKYWLDRKFVFGNVNSSGSSES